MTEQVTDLLRDIDETVLDEFDVETREEAKEQGGSRRGSYELDLEAMREMAGKEETKALADWIQSDIREHERFPPDREVRKEGARIAQNSGYDVDPNDFPGRTD